jgi:hypothetical protein
MYYIFLDVFASVTLKLWSFSFELICIINIKCAWYVINVSRLNSLIVAKGLEWHGVIRACLGRCMFYVPTFPFHLICIQNLYQIVGLNETYKIEVMKFSFWGHLVGHFGTSMQCAQQPWGSSLCGFHVAFHMLRLLDDIPDIKKAVVSR